MFLARWCRHLLASQEEDPVRPVSLCLCGLSPRTLAVQRDARVRLIVCWVSAWMVVCPSRVYPAFSPMTAGNVSVHLQLDLNMKMDGYFYTKLFIYSAVIVFCHRCSEWSKKQSQRWGLTDTIFSEGQLHITSFIYVVMYPGFSWYVERKMTWLVLSFRGRVDVLSLSWCWFLAHLTCSPGNIP